MQNVKFAKVEGDSNEEIIDEQEVAGFPTFSLYKSGKKLGFKSGMLDENKLTEFIKSKL